MFIMIEHRNLEIRKTHNDFSVQVRTFYSLSVLRFFDVRRETQSFYGVFFIWPPSRVAPIAHKFVSPQRAPKVEPPCSASSFNSLTFFKIPKILHTLPVRDIICTRQPPFLISAIMTSLSDTSALHVRHTCAQVCT